MKFPKPVSSLLTHTRLCGQAFRVIQVPYLYMKSIKLSGMPLISKCSFRPLGHSLWLVYFGGLQGVLYLVNKQNWYIYLFKTVQL